MKDNKYIPCVVQATYQGNFVIKVEFNDGLRKEIDFSKWLKGGIFEDLRDEKKFRDFFIDGMTITWSNGADIAPETLYASDEV